MAKASARLRTITCHTAGHLVPCGYAFIHYYLDSKTSRVRVILRWGKALNMSEFEVSVGFPKKTATNNPHFRAVQNYSE